MTAAMVFFMVRLLVTRNLVFLSTCNFYLFRLLLVFIQKVGGHAGHRAEQSLHAVGLWVVVVSV